jgi:hypothetical protein
VRPRDEDVRATPEAVELTKRILRHLGVEGGRPAGPINDRAEAVS